MKTIFLGVFIFISAAVRCQTLDTVSVSLTLRSQDWVWAIGQYGEGNDSLTRAKIRAIRSAIITANPPSWTTNVTINSVPGNIVIGIYKAFCNAPFNVVIAMGSNNTERTTIYTNIRAINNSALQFYISQVDTFHSTEYLRLRSKGKTIILDN